MPGRSKTVQQQELYMSTRNEGKSQATAAAVAGVSERTGRRMESADWRAGDQRPRRRHRTRADPFADVWEAELLPLLQAHPDLQAVTLLRQLQEQYPGRFPETQLRTLQRRIRRWRGVAGPEQVVLFPQQAVPGAQALCDFTVMNRLAVTIAGERFDHRLVHVRLGFSGQAYAEVVQGGESFTALARGIRHALESFGGVPQTLRTDSLAAAYRNEAQDLGAEARRTLTASYEAFCACYGLQPTRNNLGVSHENGGIESPHGHLKTSLDQALILRGGRDFPTIAAYQSWLQEVMGRQNARRAALIAREAPFLRPLPAVPAAVHSTRTATVSGNSTIDVARCTYSVPSRLIGHRLSIHLFDDHLEAYLGCEAVHHAVRRYPTDRTTRTWCIDFRHVIGSLRKKPGAFRNLAYRDALHPSASFLASWHALDEAGGDPSQAVRIYLDILFQAAQHGIDVVEAYLVACQEAQRLPTQQALLRWLQQHDQASVAASLERLATGTAVRQHTLASYDELCPGTAGATVIAGGAA
jgi:transposase InsO family protein